MGVKGLHTYLEGRLPSAKNVVNLPDLAALSGSSTVVVDGMALIRKMYPPDLEWVVGGQFAECWACVADFVRAFAACRLRLVVFFDGGIDDAKIAEWRGRRQKDLSKCERVVEALSRGEHPAKSCWMPPPNISKAVGGAFAEQGCDVYFTAGEADREMAAYCTARRCAAVLAKDSDFFILPVPAYLNLDTLDLRSNPPRVTAYRRADVEAALGLPSALLPDGRVPSQLNGGLDTVNSFYWYGIVAAAIFIESKSLDMMFGKKPDDFSPGMLGYDVLGQDSPGLRKAEITNGRIAMVAIVVFAFEEAIFKAPVVKETSIFFKPIWESLGN